MESFETDAPETGSAVGRFLARRWVPILVVVLVGVFVAQNRSDVSVHIFWATVTSPLWLVLSLVFLLGVLAGAYRSRRR
ncbi:LapA family protein [Sanguibacter antarcticus]|uniref:Uncharacterized protein DUF1049 n=1 Tax=Sanguibacter antarcticus TaxID=372484 RepID=A0A2A9E7N9_9MICO|nr:LapA family protein [Sanguibacter antarcticus]PFG34325.1 uncharacterized protein DUF1049 [Sanguibacter antarcticus]